MVASLRGLCDVARHVLKRAAEVNSEEVKSLLDQQDDNGQSSLMFASVKGHRRVAELLLKRGAEVDQQDDEGRSALMLASSEGHVGVTELLLKKRAQINLQDNQGLSALMHATKNMQSDTAKLLLQGGADVDQQSRHWESALSIAFNLKKWNSALITLLQEGIINEVEL